MGDIYKVIQKSRTVLLGLGPFSPSSPRHGLAVLALALSLLGHYDEYQSRGHALGGFVLDVCLQWCSCVIAIEGIGRWTFVGFVVWVLGACCEC
jgi:hypothetical protein